MDVELFELSKIEQLSTNNSSVCDDFSNKNEVNAEERSQYQSNDNTKERTIKSKNGDQMVNLFLINLVLCYANFGFGCVFAVLGPILPKEAKSHDVSEAWIGMIISQYQIANVIGSILFGNILKLAELKYTLMLGLFIEGFCNILFGFLQYCPSATIFIIFGMLLRTVQGLANALFYVSCLTIVVLVFPDRIPTIIARNEMCVALGLIFGPGIGGILSQFGENYMNAGFSLPFYVFGIILIIAPLLAFTLLNKTGKSENLGKTSMWDILQNINILLNILLTVNGCLLIGFNDATLDLHLKTFTELTPSMTGGIFVINGAVYTLITFFWSDSCSKVINPQMLCLISCLFALIAFSIIGPLPFFDTNPKLWLVIIGQILYGLGLGGLIVGSYAEGFKEAIDSGFPDDISTYSAISGCYAAAIATGVAIGPVIGGYLLGEWGYQRATIPIIVLQIIMICVIISLNLFRHLKKIHHKSEEYIKFS